MSTGMMRFARSFVGPPVERASTPSQASESRLSDVSTVDFDQAQARDTTVTWAPCACGGVIVVLNEGLLRYEVDRHQQNDVRHLRWRIAQLEAELQPLADRKGRVYE